MSLPTELAQLLPEEVDPADPKWDASFGAGQARYRGALHQIPAEVRRPQVPFDAPVSRHLTMDTMADAWGGTSDTHWCRLTNEVNDFGYCLDRLHAWKASLDTAESAEARLALLAEVVLPLAHHALNLPMALKSRFAFAVWRTHHEMDVLLSPPGSELSSRSRDSHQAPKWNEMWSEAERWEAIPRLRAAVDAIYPQSRDSDPVFSYRDRFMHRIPPYLEQGVWSQAHLVRGNGKWTVHMRDEPPLRLSTVLDALVRSHAAAADAHAEFGRLLSEHWAAVQDTYLIARGD
jgi:hypothetical protein